MPKSSDHKADSFDTENTGGLLTGFLAEEENVDRRFLWKLGSWGAASVGAVIVALMANQSSLGLRREQVASAELTRHLQQGQLLQRETENEMRRMASAIDTLNGDRDRLFSRVTTLELGLDSATGALAKQSSAPAQTALPAMPIGPTASFVPTESQPAPQAAAPPPAIAQVATTTAAPPASMPEKKRVAATVSAQAMVPAPAMAPTEPAPATVSSITPAAPEIPKESLKDASKETSKESPKESSKEISKEALKETSKEASIKPAPATPAGNATAGPTAGPAAGLAPSAPAPLVASKSIMAPPDPAATKLIEPPPPVAAVAAAPIPETVASVEENDANAASAIAVQHTEFAIDVGSANSLGGLRALWRGLLKSHSALGALRPIVMVKESNTGFGMQLRLAAGPLSDAATAAKICAALIESDRSCETTVFDGQRLAMKADEQPAVAPKPARPLQHRRSYPKHAAAVVEPAPKPEPTTFSSLFNRR